MTTRTDLRELFANGENSHVEFDSDAIADRQLAMALVAFANLQGGCVLLGVDDQGTVRGLVRADPSADTASGAEAHTYRRLEEWVMQACRDNIRPELVPYFEILRDVEPGRDVAVVQVERGWSVHHVLHGQRHTCFIRAGSASREASAEYLARLLQQRVADRPDRRPVSGTSIADLDRRRLEDYFGRVREHDVPASTAPDEEWIPLLVDTQFLDDSDQHPATVAGLLLFGHNASRYLPHAKIDATAWFGREKDDGARQRRTMGGPIVRLNAADGSILEPGLVEQAVEFARWDYPEEAVREAIINAVVHRDYLLSGTDIELSVYSDRLEVVSPGRLPNGITPARMRSGSRRARNMLLKDVMRDYGYLDRLGMGIPRKIMRSMRAHNRAEPELIEGDEAFTLRLWKDLPRSER